MNALKIRQNLLHRRVPPGQRLGETLANNVFQSGGDSRPHLGRKHGLFAHNGMRDGRLILSLERQDTRCELIEEYSERPNVRPLVEFHTLHLLR